ncbi:MAG: ABC transporter permease subunit [Bryobacteraceae bacterium]|nr:ABC transporter permease subunit [Bryobacteraceae bacterium]
MRLSLILVILRREVIDLLRDRRTLIGMVVLPLVAFPLMGIGVSKFIEETGKKNEAQATTVGVKSLEMTPDLQAAIARSGMRPIVEKDLRTAIEQKRVAAGIEQNGQQIRLLVDATRAASNLVADRLRTALAELKEERIRESLAKLSVPAAVLQPFRVERVNVASERKMGGFLLGTMLGYIVILLMFSGGMHPAVDMTAGERERKTMEALLASPASRAEIVLAKILATVVALYATVLLTLGSFFISMKSSAMMNDAKFAALLGNISLDWGTLALLLLTMFPVALMAGALMIAIASFARSFKEAQSYLTPLLLLVILPALLGGLPGTELSPALSLIPIFNASQLLKAVLQGEFTMANFLTTFFANVAYAGICFYFALRTFKNENVMFRS